jgi:hypothetical protein
MRGDKKRSRARQAASSCSEAHARTRSRHEGRIYGRQQRKHDMITSNMRLEGRTWVDARKRKKCVLHSFVQNVEHVEGMSKVQLQPGNYGC